MVFLDGVAVTRPAETGWEKGKINFSPIEGKKETMTVLTLSSHPVLLSDRKKEGLSLPLDGRERRKDLLSNLREKIKSAPFEEHYREEKKKTAASPQMRPEEGEGGKRSIKSSRLLTKMEGKGILEAVRRPYVARLVA